jgi:hypothetical protein
MKLGEEMVRSVNRYLYLTLFLLALAICLNVANAQNNDNSSDGDFFPKDYATDLQPHTDSDLKKSLPGSFFQSRPTIPTKTPSANNTNTLKPSSPLTLNNIVPDLNASGVPIFNLSLVVNGEDLNHLNTTLTTLKDLNRLKKIKVGKVHIVGNPYVVLPNFNNVTGLNYSPSNDQNPATLSNNKNFDLVDYKKIVEGVSFSNLPPIEYKIIKRSPTWIVSTEEGRYLLEAIERPLSELFNDKGEFIKSELAIQGIS